MYKISCVHLCVLGWNVIVGNHTLTIRIELKTNMPNIFVNTCVFKGNLRVEKICEHDAQIINSKFPLT
jgi:hypothetical protein